MPKLKFLLEILCSYLPTKLPVGLQEFNDFTDSIIRISGEYADRDSMVFAIASMVIHLDSKKGYVRKNQIVQMLRKSAANQVASQVFQDIKTKQDKKRAEATAQEQVANEAPI